MDTSPLISCIVPTYNREKKLKDAVDCILNQTYRPLELIIVDDASSKDYVPSVIENISNENVDTQVIIHDQNKGASAARNSGIRAANGRYVAFLDDDDQWLMHKIEKQVMMLEQSNSSLSYCWVRRVGGDGSIRAEHTPKSEGKVTNDLFLGNSTGTTSTLVVTKDLCNLIGGFDQSLPRWNDWDFVLRASRHTSFILVPEILVHQYNWEGNQLSDDLEKLKTAQSRFINKHQDFATRYGMYNTFLSQTYFDLGYSAGMSGNYKYAIKSFINAIRLNPFKIKFYIYLLAFSGGKFTVLPAQFTRRAVYQWLH